jgi:hypothetical protein
MNKQRLSELNLLYIDSLEFKDNCFSLEIKAGDGFKNITIILNHILSFDFSRNSLDKDDYVEINIIEISHEYRILNKDDLKSYSFFVNDTEMTPKLHVIYIYGSGKAINVVCKEIHVDTEMPITLKA